MVPSHERSTNNETENEASNSEDLFQRIEMQDKSTPHKPLQSQQKTNPIEEPSALQEYNHTNIVNDTKSKQ